jgi:hypothetical protein
MSADIRAVLKVAGSRVATSVVANAEKNGV